MKEFFQNMKGERGIHQLFEKLFTEELSFPQLRQHDIRVDIKEGDGEYVVVADIPGATKEQISIGYKESQLTISVEVEKAEEETGLKFIRKERSLSHNSRSFLMLNIKEDEIKAKYENGILTVIIPKQEIINKRVNVD